MLLFSLACEISQRNKRGDRKKNNSNISRSSNWEFFAFFSFFCVLATPKSLFSKQFVSWDKTWTKAQKSYDFLLTLKKEDSKPALLKQKQKKGISTGVLCCFFVPGNTKSLFLLFLTFWFLKRKLHRLKLKRIRTFCY